MRYEPIYVIARNYEQFIIYVNRFADRDKFLYLDRREQIMGLSRYIEVVSLLAPHEIPNWLLEELHVRRLALRYDDPALGREYYGERLSSMKPSLLLLCDAPA